MVDGKTHRSLGKFYSVWKNMKARCLKPYSTSYADYGGRGIKLDIRWVTFAGFYADMYKAYIAGKERYGDDISIERIDNDGNYTLSNCKWIPRNDQPKNTRANIFVVRKPGEDAQTIAEWSRRTGINYDTLRGRLVRNGRVPSAEAFTKPVRNRYQPMLQYDMTGKLVKRWPTIKEASKALGIQESGIIRAAKGDTAHSGGFIWGYGTK